jgi:D-proline reductase (dithiol) PrdB
MARIEDIHEPTRHHIETLECPALPGRPWVEGPPLAQRTIAMVTSAALHRRGEPPFPAGTAEHRELPADLPAAEMLMSHISINFDRTGFQTDVNTAFPIDRLHELAGQGVIGRVAPTHYSVMGSTDPALMEETVEALVARMRRDAADAALLVPV